MKIQKQLTDKAILEEMGRRIARQRLNLDLTQAEVATRSGLGKRTVERIEAGESAQMESLIRIMRALNLLGQLDSLLPEDTGLRPLELLKLRKKERQRASASGKSGLEEKKAEPGWSWGDEK
ncbi:MAG: helix-turn-helix domain-containing protein [Geobacter sp.]|nr:helix-turn-helix domain-containing protein [Geobacter sp.]